MKSLNKVLILIKVLSRNKLTLKGGLRVSNSDTLRYLPNIWSRVLEATKNLNLPSVNSIELVNSQSSKHKVSEADLIKVVTQINKILAQEVVSRWQEMPQETKLNLEELAQIQLCMIDKLGSWKTYPVKVQLAFLWLLIKKRQNILQDYTASTQTLTSAIFDANNTINLSDTDRDIFLEALENPPELPERLKLEIRQFREKYEI